jgi:dTDP-4-amino-4,6-dideoxygalactose transaminase
MVTTNNADLAERLRRFRSHGIVRMPERGEWYYEIGELGYNFRLTDIQSALGVSQMKKLDRFIDRRNEIAATYRELLADLPIGLPPAAPQGFRHGYHLFPVTVSNRPVVFASLRDSGIGVQVHYVPVNQHPISSDLIVGNNWEVVAETPICKSLYSKLISIPIHASLSQEELSHTVRSITQSVIG